MIMLSSTSNLLKKTIKKQKQNKQTKRDHILTEMEKILWSKSQLVWDTGAPHGEWSHSDLQLEITTVQYMVGQVGCLISSQ